jgi:hypothetical protein
VSENGPYVESRKNGPLNAGYRPNKADAACRLDAREMSTFPLAAGSAVSYRANACLWPVWLRTEAQSGTAFDLEADYS